MPGSAMVESLSTAQLHAVASRPGGLWIDPSNRSDQPQRATFVACEPAVWIRGAGEILEILPGPAGDRGWLARIEAADPGPGPSWDRLATLARRLRLPLPIPNPDDGRAPPTFRGGFAGCFSYDLGRRFEDIPAKLPSGLPWDFLLGFYDEVLEWTGSEPLLHSLGGNPGRLRAIWNDATTSSLPPIPVDSALCGPISAEMSEKEHRAGVLRIRELIRSGTIYQANLTLRFSGECSDPGAPLATFRRLRKANPAPHAQFQDLPGLAVVSASPESFLDLSTSGHVLSRPIKGTAPRGGTPSEDHSLRADLLRSPKDRSELSMIVDLVRNDIGRVCVPGSVDRRAQLLAEAHPSVWHLVGEARGRLAPGRDAFDLVRAAFPPGSCIGAPKVRAMQVLEELERSRRGPYTGALGWIGQDGSSSLSVTIRTLCFSGGRVSYGVGGGIVFDSQPAAEWAEALLKGRALVDALQGTARRSAPPGRGSRSNPKSAAADRPPNPLQN
jgi:para-aminobenzoate synthetase component 1